MSSSSEEEVNVNEEEEEDVDNDSAIEEDMDSDAEDEDELLLELYAAGKLKAGLNLPQKQFANDVTKMKQLTDKLRVDQPWIETMDIINNVAEMAPELAMELKEQEESGKSINEFKRETMFHRQAQLAVIEGVARLKSQGIPTTRPEDYFAEMMKSDAHMQKVRRTLLEKQAALKTREKVREIREHKKVSKQKQVESVLRKQKEKRELNENIKKYRKGIKTDLDFLDSKKSDKHTRNFKKKNFRQKDDEKNFKGEKNFKRGKNFKSGKSKGFHKGGPKKNVRPGKERRKVIKNKKK